MIVEKRRLGRKGGCRILTRMAFAGLFVIASGCSAQGDDVNQASSTGATSVQGMPLELSGCAVVEGGVLMVEDEAIGAVLLATDMKKQPLNLTQVKLERKKKQRAPYADRPKLFPVQDFEDIASDRSSNVYFLGSHNGKDGERRPDREFLLYGEWEKKQGEIKVLGENYQLLDLAAPVLADLGCNLGLTRETVDPLLNMEGLAWHEGQLYIGLRAPLTPDGKGIILVGDADALIGGGFAASLKAITLDLDGGGIRALDWDPVKGALLVVSGAHEDGAAAQPALWACDTAGESLQKIHAFDAEVARKLPEGVCRLPEASGGQLLVVLDGGGKNDGGEVVFLDW